MDLGKKFVIEADGGTRPRSVSNVGPWHYKFWYFRHTTKQLLNTVSLISKVKLWRTISQEKLCRVEFVVMYTSKCVNVMYVCTPKFSNLTLVIAMP